MPFKKGTSGNPIPININEKEQDSTANTSSKVINDWRNWEF
jgi:hypothetical protein